MPLLGQYTFKADSSLKIDVSFNPHMHEIKISPTPPSTGQRVMNFFAPPRVCSGSLTMKRNHGAQLCPDIATNAFIINAMHSHPRGSGLGAVLIYEFSEHANRSQIKDLGIYLVAGTAPTDPSPRGFYGKMGFKNTMQSSKIQLKYHDLTAAQQQPILDSAAMQGRVGTVSTEAQKSWSKKWTRANPAGAVFNV